MVVQKWTNLAKLADLAFAAQSQKLSKLRAQEAELLQQRLKLTQMNNAALGAFVGVHPAHRQSGDFHWQEWVGRNMERLGREQAQVRALMEIHKPEVRKAFGRKSVLEKLVQRKTQ